MFSLTTLRLLPFRSGIDNRLQPNRWDYNPTDLRFVELLAVVPDVSE